MTKMLSMRKRAREQCEKEKLGVGRGLIGRHHNCPTGQQELSWPPNLFRCCIFQCRHKHCRLFPHESIIFNLFSELSLWLISKLFGNCFIELDHCKYYSIFTYIKIAFYFIYKESYNWRFYKIIKNKIIKNSLSLSIVTNYGTFGEKQISLFLIALKIYKAIWILENLYMYILIAIVSFNQKLIEKWWKKLWTILIIS